MTGNHEQSSRNHFKTILLLLVFIEACLIVALLFWIFALEYKPGFSCDDTSSGHNIQKRSLECPPGCRKIFRRGPQYYQGKDQRTLRRSNYSADTSHLQQRYKYIGNGNAERQGGIGVVGLRGRSGAWGSSGARGPPGVSGKQGSVGPEGPMGERGYPGISGAFGERGLQGPRGLSGASGSQGPPGLSGASGLQGPRGLSGERGSQGPRGLSGERGLQGPRGLPGERGLQGSRGLSGERGLQGPPFDSPGEVVQNQTKLSNTFMQDASVGPLDNFHLPRRGDQGSPEQNFVNLESDLQTKELKFTKLMQELKLHSHPRCVDALDHQGLISNLKNNGKVSFMIMVDLAESLYCIVHA